MIQQAPLLRVEQQRGGIAFDASRLEEVSAGVEERTHDRERGAIVCSAAEMHRAQTQLGNVEAGSPQST